MMREMMIQMICAVLTVSEKPKASLKTMRSSTSGEAVSRPTDIEYESQERKETPSQSLPIIVPRTIPASRKNRNAIVLLIPCPIYIISFLIQYLCNTDLL